MSGKSHVIKDVKHLDVANAVKSLAIVNENYKCPFTHFEVSSLLRYGCNIACQLCHDHV